MSTENPSTKQRRFTAKKKQEIVLRLLKGEALELISREISVPAAILNEWRETFLTSGFNGLKTKPKDDRDERIKELERKIGHRSRWIMSCSTPRSIKWKPSTLLCRGG